MLSTIAPIASGNVQASDAVERLQTTIDYLNGAFGQSVPDLLPPGLLETVRTNLKSTRGDMQNYANEKDVRRLQEANNRIDGVLPSTFGLPVPFKQQGLEQISKQITEQRKRLDADAQKLREQIQALSAELKKLQDATKATTGEINQQKSRLDTAIADFQKQFSEAQAARQAEFAKSEKSRSDACSELLRRVEEDHKSMSEARHSQFEEWFSKVDALAAELRKEHHQKANEEIDLITKMRLQAEKIVGLIGEHGMVRGYQTQADKSREAFRFWSATAVCALLSWIVIGLIAFWLTFREDLTWSTVARQFLISTPFLLLATFAGYQAFVQQMSATRFRRRELEIASLEPFLATLTQEDSNEIKKLMVPKFFGHGDLDDTPPPPDLSAIVTGVADRVLAAMEKKR